MKCQNCGTEVKFKMNIRRNPELVEIDGDLCEFVDLEPLPRSISPGVRVPPPALAYYNKVRHVQEPQKRPEHSKRESPQDFAEALSKFNEEKPPEGQNTRWGPIAFVILRQKEHETKPDHTSLPR